MMRRVYLACIYMAAVFVYTSTGSPFQRPSRFRSNRDALITAVRLSSDGRMLSVGRADGSVTLWDTKRGQRLWIAQGDWRLTRRLGVGPGDRYSDSIVDLTAPGSGRLLSVRPASVLNVFFLAGDLEMLIVERDGGFRRVLADDGHTLGVYGVFFGAKKDKQLEGIIGADVSKGREVLAITGSLQGIPYEIDLRKLEETQPPLSYVVLSDWLTRLNLEPGTSFVATERLGIKVSAAASKPLLNSAGGNVKELRYCDGGSTLIGVTDDGKLIGWKQKERQIDTKSAYERLAFRDGKGAFFVPRLACNDQFLMSTGPGGKYGNVQLWDTNEGVLVKHFANPQILFGKEIALARSGSFAATLTSSGTIVWQLGGGDMKRIGSVTLSTKKGGGTQKHQQVQGVSISDDGSTLALTDGETVFLLDLPSLTGERRFGSSVVVKEIKIER